MSALQIQRAHEARNTREYGCSFFRRLLPWGEPGPSSEGMALFGVPPGGTTQLHAHEEVEFFLVVQGTCSFLAGGQSHACAEGDVVRVPAHVEHAIQNLSHEHELKLVSLWSTRTFSGA